MNDIDMFQQALRSHDWSFEYSDDQEVWRRGRANYQKLLAQVKLSAAHAAVFNLFNNHGGHPSQNDVKKVLSRVV